MRETEVVQLREKTSKKVIRILLDAISQAGVEADFKTVDRLVKKIPKQPSQDYLCQNLLFRLAYSRNRNRRDALVTALSCAEPNNSEIREKVFGKATWLAENDPHGPVAVWAGAIVEKFVNEPDKKDKAEQALATLKKRIEKKNWGEIRSFVISKRPVMEKWI